MALGLLARIRQTAHMDGSSDDARAPSLDSVEDALTRIARGAADPLDEVWRLSGVLSTLIVAADEWCLGDLYCLWAGFLDYLDAGEMLDGAEAGAVIELAATAAQEWVTLDTQWNDRLDYFERWTGFLGEYFPALYGPGGRIQRFLPDALS